MIIFHIARADEWAAARGTGSYTVSTLGKSLAEVGYIHAARQDQVRGVWREFYARSDVSKLLLAIDTDRLTSPWSEDAVAEKGGATYPHIHGPLNLSAVVRVTPMDRRGRAESFASVFFKESASRMVGLIVVFALAIVGALIAQSIGGRWLPLVGLVCGAAVGYGVIRLVRQFGGPSLPAG